jgi:hypothetical protein
MTLPGYVQATSIVQFGLSGTFVLQWLLFKKAALLMFMIGLS